jgi:hypothetical protein
VEGRVNMNAPDYAFKAIIKWAQVAKHNIYSFYPQDGLLRSKNVVILFLPMNNAKQQFLLSVQSVPTQNKTSRHVIAIDIVPQLLLLLQNCNIMIHYNLVLDMQNPLQ